MPKMRISRPKFAPTAQRGPGRRSVSRPVPAPRRGVISSLVAPFFAPLFLTAIPFAVMPLAAQESSQNPFPGFSASGIETLAASEQPSGWAESFETAGISWRPLYQANDVRITEHIRSDAAAHSGKRSEKITLHFPKPGYAFFGHYVDYPLLVDETAPTLWIKTSQGKFSAALLVVLPKTLRPDTHTPLTLLLGGTVSQSIDEWEPLTFPADLERELERLVYAVRAEHHIAVDTDDAYIRQVILFTEQKRGDVQVWIDDLKISEHAPRPLEFLRQEERDNRFAPINLLGHRFQVTESTIALESALGTERELPEEPFGINGPKIEKEQSRIAEAPISPYLLTSKAGNGITPTGFESGGVLPAGDSQSGVIQSGVIPSETGSGAGILSLPAEDSTIISGSGTLPASADYPDSFPHTSDDPYPEIRFNQQLLTVEGKKPIGIRAIEYQGEPLAFLKGLQFNTVWLKSPPSRELLEEARRADIWLIAPPPVGAETVTSAAGTPVEAPADVLPYFNRTAVSADYDPVLLWDLGTNRSADKAQWIKNSADYIRLLDSRRRPILCRTESELIELADIGSGIDSLLLTRKPILGSLEFNDYGKWLKNYQRIGTPDFPYWNEIQTEPDPSLLAQCRFFGAVDDMPGIVSYEQMRQQVRLSLAAGIHGLLFTSETPLNDPDREAQYRAAALELINLELGLVEAWFSAGTVDEPIQSEDQSVTAAVLRTERTSLLIPLAAESESQLVFGQAAANNRSFVVPVRDGYSADMLLPGNMRKVPSHRRAGGVRLDLDEISMNSLIYLAQSDWDTRAVAEQSKERGNRMAELAIRLAKMRLDLFRTTLDQLEEMDDRGEIPTVNRRPLLQIPEQTTVVQQTCSAIALAEEYLHQDDPAQAYLQAERALREIRMNERSFRKAATQYDLCCPVLPVSVTFDTLPSYIENYRKISSGQMKVDSANRLVGGDMECSEDWNNGGWVRTDLPVPNVTASLNRDGAAARSGERGLLFSLMPNNIAPVELPNAPLRVTVPISVRTGELICVQGWIRIPQTLINGADGFMIYDSHGGEALAQRYREESDWRPFAFYRYAAWDGVMKIIFEMSAFGQVYLDDVAVHTVH